MSKIINPTAAVIVIGNEILSGRTLDTNTRAIANALAKMGIDLTEVRIIPDDETTIIETIQALSPKYKYVYTTGGIGPTHDDITSQSVARAFNVEYVLDPVAYEMLREIYESRGEIVTPAREKMAWVPKGSILIPNPGTPPGFVIENVFVLAGVPSIMTSMLNTSLKMLKGGREVRTKQLEVMLGESIIASDFARLQLAYRTVEMGSYPFVRDQRYGTSLVLRSNDYESLERAFLEVEEMAEAHSQ